MPEQSSHVSFRGMTVVLLIVLIFPASTAAAFETPPPPDEIRLQRVRAVIAEVQPILDILAPVRARIAERNPLVVSVERTDEGYVLVFDREFLGRLDEEELRAAIAHEFGHIWIYLHHPYLHTEMLANEIAMRAVSRDNLLRLYAKLWSYTAVAGKVEEVVGPALASR